MSLSFGAAHAQSLTGLTTAAEDSYGLAQAENDGTAAPQLINCARDRACPEFVAASFWISLIEFSETDSESVACNWVKRPDGMIRPIFLDEWDRQGTLIADFGVCNRYADMDALQKFMTEMEDAALAGSSEAANEIGYYALTNPRMFDPLRARQYLEPCARENDAMCQFNLARVDTLISEDGCGSCLQLLRDASAGSDDYGIDMAAQIAEALFGLNAIITPVPNDTMDPKRRLSEILALFPSWMTINRVP